MVFRHFDRYIHFETTKNSDATTVMSFINIYDLCELHLLAAIYHLRMVHLIIH